MGFANENEIAEALASERGVTVPVLLGQLLREEAARRWGLESDVAYVVCQRCGALGEPCLGWAPGPLCPACQDDPRRYKVAAIVCVGDAYEVMEAFDREYTLAEVMADEGNAADPPEGLLRLEVGEFFRLKTAAAGPGVRVRRIA